MGTEYETMDRKLTEKEIINRSWVHMGCTYVVKRQLWTNGKKERTKIGCIIADMLIQDITPHFFVCEILKIYEKPVGWSEKQVGDIMRIKKNNFFTTRQYT